MRGLLVLAVVCISVRYAVDAATTQDPATTQPAATTQPPAATQPAATTQPPAATQPAATTQPPAATQPAATTQAPDKLRCRRCEGAATLDDCTVSITCADDEICFMDEVITDAYAIAYNGGCRALDVCKKGPNMAGKREEATGLVACSKCCDEKLNPECNSKLCGIKSSNTSNSQCYHCSNGVEKASQCTQLISCQSDEVCGAERFKLSDAVKYTFECLNKRLCTLLTQEALKRKRECLDGTGYCPDVGGKRAVSGTKQCTACCGDALCNADECEDVIDQLYTLWDNKVLDFNTLKRKTVGSGK